ncbi:MAG: DsbA family protein, partial [Proteobacteria bacterium]|nr:DsbA family protein [Pseudomonadota bacterium]
QLAQALGIEGTPAIVVGDTLVPGALQKDHLKELIADARKK